MPGANSRQFTLFLIKSEELCENNELGKVLTSNNMTRHKIIIHFEIK